MIELTKYYMCFKLIQNWGVGGVTILGQGISRISDLQGLREHVAQNKFTNSESFDEHIYWSKESPQSHGLSGCVSEATLHECCDGS